MKNQVQRGQEWLSQLLELMAMPTAVVTEEADKMPVESDACWLIIESTNLSSSQIEVVIGDQGKSIDAIQYLGNTILNLSAEEELQGSYTVEIDGYRLKRYRELQSLAQQAAQQVRETGQEMKMPALSSAERRQIHTFLKDEEDLATESRGQEPDRRLVVRLKESGE